MGIKLKFIIKDNILFIREFFFKEVSDKIDLFGKKLNSLLEE